MAIEIVGRSLGSLDRHPDETELRVVGRENLEGAILFTIQGETHVGLARAEPNLAHEHVTDFAA